MTDFFPASSVLLCMLLSYAFCFDNVVKPNCVADADSCEFNWSIGYFQTMTTIPTDGKGSRLPVIPINGTLYARTDCGSLENTRKLDETDNFVTGDGTPKFMFAINDQVPGPSIVVYEGQEVIVHVHNKLLMEGISIHWHGLLQRGTPYMDGVSRVTQYPINPGETFTYRFKAAPTGSFWYHSHLGAQRSDGIAGAFIILKKPQPPLTKEKHNNGEFIFLVDDWYDRSYTQEINLSNWGLNKFLGSPLSENCAASKKTYDMSGTGQEGKVAPVINARVVKQIEEIIGKYNNPYVHNVNAYLPLETFMVQQGHTYTFRMIGMTAMSFYRISIDNHKFTVIAVDGVDIEPEEAESIIIQSGERYDVQIHTDASVDNYWIRLEDMTVKDIEGKPLPMTKGYGILRYGGAREVDPTSSKQKCSAAQLCRIINCIFGKFPVSTYTYCTPVSELKSPQHVMQDNPVPIISNKKEMQEFFLNFHFSVTEDDPTTGVSVINHLQMVLPASPPLVNPNSLFPATECPTTISSFASACTHVLKLHLGKVIQFVLINIMYEATGIGRSHPIHMHGHRFHVLKIGFPEYDLVTGNMTKINQDIKCESIDCARAQWANQSWNFGNIPGMNIQNPALKDTVIVPWGGYAVVRIVADNPGYWYMHCHIETHNINGMALILQEGEQIDMPTLPNDMPVCGKASKIQFRSPPRKQQSLNSLLSLPKQSVQKGLTESTEESKTTFKSAIGISVIALLAALSLVLNIIGAVILYKRRSMYTYHPYLPPDGHQPNKQDTDEKTKLLQ